MTALAEPPPAAAPPRQFPRKPQPGRPSPARLALEGVPPDGTPLTEAAFYALPTSLHCELVNGRLEYLPMPDERHQTIIAFFFDLLRAQARSLGLAAKVIFTGLRTRVNGNERDPDVQMLLDENDPRRANRRWAGADLMVEVVSPDDPNRDHVVKRAEYLAAGVREYWIIDPRPKTSRDRRGRTVTVLVRDGDAWRERVFEEGATATSELLPGLNVDVTVCLNAD